MLIGMFIRKGANIILNIRRWLFPLFFGFGLVLAALELHLLKHFDLLVYNSHTLGFSIMAISACYFALSKTDSQDSFLSSHGKNYAKRIYAFSQPIYFIIMFISTIIAQKYFGIIRAFSSFIVFLICLLIAYIIGIVKLQ